MLAVVAGGLVAEPLAQDASVTAARTLLTTRNPDIEPPRALESPMLVELVGPAEAGPYKETV